MILIAHRGNINGPKPELENSIPYLESAIEKGYSVEIDLRIKDDQLYLGHDEPQYPVSLSWIENHKAYLWIHCKDHQSYNFMLNHTYNYFWHDTDDYVRTSYNYTWAYPGKPIAGKLCIMVMPEMHWDMNSIRNMKPFGICSDYVSLLNI
jgi:glycerophosphoryl diester phosphodiesterase